MRITVIGCGRQGVTHAACLAETGHEVLGVDIDESKVSLLSAGRSWFHEPGLEEMLVRNIIVGRLRFTTSFADAGVFGEVHFLCLATRGLPGKDGYDLAQLSSATGALAPHLDRPCLVIGKSTVPPGTAASLQRLITWLAPAGSAAEVAWNPEFSRKGRAVGDILRPDRIVAGVDSAAAETVIRNIYAKPVAAGVPLTVTDLATAELVKSAANAFLALKISFINAVDDICAATGADAGALAHALGMDPRIGRGFLDAGIGYGGSSLPKDVRGLMDFADRCGAAGVRDMLDVANRVNRERCDGTVWAAWRAARGLPGARIAVWGAAFKPGTDDIQESPALEAADRLYGLGADVTVYDPVATGPALAAFPHLSYADSALDAARDADVLLIATAWPEFAASSPARTGAVMRRKVLIDACRVTWPRQWTAAGWTVPEVRAKVTDDQAARYGGGWPGTGIPGLEADTAS
jgi:UDPglucose 6-dehydrogenase